MPPLVAGIGGGERPVILSAQVTGDVAFLVLEYEDGTVERLEPVEGFVLREIASAHYSRGHRLVLVRALDPDGKELARQAFRPDSAGTYPCDEPVDIGRGVKACP